jgi:hypothetical protein
MSKCTRLTGLALAGALWGFPGISHAGLETILIQGDETPIVGFFYQNVQRPAASDNNDGEVVFVGSAKTTTLPKQSNTCLFLENTNAAFDDTVACTADPNEITPDNHRFLDFGQPTTNADGDIAWASNTTGPSSGVYRRLAATSSNETVALLGDPVPADGSGTGLFAALSLAAIADNGDVAFRANISTDTSRTQGVFLCPAGTDCNANPGLLTTVAVRNDFIPGQIVNQRRFCTFLQVAASNFGVAFQVATKNNCSKSDADESPRLGVFLKPDGAPIEKVGLQTEDAGPYPNNPGGTKYTSFVGPIALNNDGTVAFNAKVGAPTLTRLNNVLFLCEQASLCPGTNLPDGKVVTGQADVDGNVFVALSAPGLSAAGDMSFSAKLKRAGTPAFSGVYIRRDDGTIERIAVKDDPVPNELNRFFQFFPTDPAPTMSSDGRVAFKGKIVGTTKGDKKKKDGVFLFE